MPEITFRKEVTQEQYDVLQIILKLWEMPLDFFIWQAMVGDMVYRMESAADSPLYEKSGIDAENEGFNQPEQEAS